MISIVMPCYNQAPFIRDAIWSVLAQDYRFFELIIVDDASTDGTMDIVGPISALNPRIRVARHKENRGTGEALNTGFAMASGEVETWWASDNIMAPNMLRVLNGYLQRNPDVDFVYSDCWIDDVERGQRKLLSGEVGGQKFNHDRLMWHYYLGICWLWRRDLRLKAGGTFQKEPCEDYDMVLRMAEVGGKFHNIPDTLGTFTRHPANMSAKIKREYGPDHFSILVREKAAQRRQESASAADQSRV